MDILKKLAKKKNKGELIVAKPTLTGMQSPEKFLGGVVHEALQYTIQMLPQKLRDQYNGDVRHTEDLTVDGGGWHVMIVLTHMQTRKLITADLLIKNHRIKAAANPVKFAQELGHDIGRRLVVDIKNADKPYPGKVSPVQHVEGKWKGKVDGVVQDAMPGQISDIDPDSFKEKPKPLPVCDICGVTEDKYPDWDDSCEHLDTSS